MADVTATADAYLAAWNETDEAKRAELIAQTWSPGGRYVDPQADVTGHDAFGGLVAAVQERFPGYRFRRTGDADVHHDQARFGWELVSPDGEVAVSGIDVVELDGDGRLRRVTGFFDALVAA